MYAQAAFVVPDDEAIELLDHVRLGCLVTIGGEGFRGTHLPFMHDREARSLTGHIAKANPHPQHAPDGSPVFVIFQGVDAYVSPNWYPSKAQHGRAVPTWNYEAVHVHGRLWWRDDPAWLLDQLARLSARFEAGEPRPWTMDEAPAGYIERTAAGAVGLEIEIVRVEAVRKLSQNRPQPDRAGVRSALASGERPGDRALAMRMAALES